MCHWQGGSRFVRGDLQRFRAAVAARGGKLVVAGPVSDTGDDGGSVDDGSISSCLLTEESDSIMDALTRDGGNEAAFRDKEIQGFVGRANKNGIVAFGCSFRRIVYRNVLAQCWVRRCTRSIVSSDTWGYCN